MTFIKKMRNGLLDHSRLYVLLIFYLLLTTGHNVILPIINSDDHDEAAHFLYIRYLAQNHRLPFNQQERLLAGDAKADEPPLYHGLAALLFSSIDAEDVSFLEKRGPTSHLTRESTAGHWLFQTVRLDYPYEGAVLLWHLSRFFSSLLGAGAVLMTYFMALELFPGKKTRALTAAALLAFIPRFVFMSSTLNDDNILALVMAIYLFLMVRLIKGYSSWLYLAGIGLMLGLAITAKISSILVPLTTILLVCFLAWRQQWSLAIFVKRIAIIVLFAFLVSSWWFGFVIWQFGDFENRGLVGGAINAIVPEVVSNASNVDLLSAIQGAEVAIEKRGQESFGEWLSYFGKSFWEARLVIWPNQFLLSGYAAWLIWGLAGLIGVGIIGTWWKGDEFKRIWIGFFLLHILAFLPFMLIRHYLNGFVQETAQGRHVLMPAGAAVGILLMVGWSYWTGTRRRYWLGPILPALFLFWSVTQLYFIYHLFPKSLPVSTEETTRARVPQVQVSLNQMLFDTFELVGYSAQVLPDQSALEVTLVWTAHQPSLDDYLTVILLSDQTGQPVSSWIGHPAGGVYPTRAWESEDVIYDQVKLPIHNLDPGDYVLEVYLLEGYQRPVRRVTAPLVSAPISLVGSAKHLSGFNTLLVETGEETVEVQYQLWSSDFFNFGYPLYRYRATIPIVWNTDSTLSSNQTVALKLIAPDGRVFEPLNPSGNLRSFVVDPDWPSGLYRLNIEVLRQGEVIGSETSPNLLQVENVERQFVLPPMTQQVNANFYDVIKLWGYDLSASRLQPGDVLSISSYWESLRTINQRLRIFNHLYDMNNKLWLANDYYAPPYRGGTIMWVPGQIVADESQIWLDPEVPHGIYTVHIGLFLEPDKDNQLRLPLIIDGDISDVTYVNLGPIKIGGPPSNVLALDVTPQHPRDDKLSDLIKLNGYDLAYLPDAQELHLTLFWESISVTERNYKTFVHLQDESGQIVAQKDVEPANGVYPTSLWDANEVVKDEIVFSLPSGLSRSNYRLSIGMYDFSTGERLHVPNSPDNTILLATFDTTNLTFQRYEN